MKHPAISVGSVRRRVGTGTRSAALGLAVTLVAFGAQAKKYGEKHITANTKLTEDQFGSVVFDADNISLDCDGYEVHISSYSKLNCSGSPGDYSKKCGIVAINKDNIKIKDCRVVGGFDYGVYLKGTEDADMSNVKSNAHIGLVMSGTTSTHGTRLRASDTRDQGILIADDVGGYYDDIVVENGGFDGLEIKFSTDTVLNNLQSWFNWIGLRIRSSDGITVSGGDIFGNSLPGIVASHSDDLLVEDTNVELNGFDQANNVWTGQGIDLYNVNSSLFLNNEITSNYPPCDVYAGSDSSFNQWTGNTIGVPCIFEDPH